MSPFLIALAILPGLLISYVIYRLDKYDREPGLPLIISFIIGALVTIPAMKLEYVATQMGFEESQHLGMLLFFSYCIVAFSEELVKFVGLMIYPYHQKAFNEPLDGIIYAVFIGMGFATIENIIYADRFGYETTVVRAFTAVPAHGVFAIIMGYYVGLAKFDKAKKYKLIATGLLLSILVHGTYDFFILQEYYDWLMGFATLTLVISSYFAFKLIMLHRKSSFSNAQNLALAQEKNTEQKTVVVPDEQLSDTEDELIELMKKQEEDVQEKKSDATEDNSDD